MFILRFRAWHKTDKKMSNPFGFEDLYRDDEYVCVYEFGSILNDIIIMQSTGEKDINGVEIFESDLVSRDLYYESTKTPHEVTFHSGEWHLDGSFEEVKNIKVLGNIYEGIKE